MVIVGAADDDLGCDGENLGLADDVVGGDDIVIDDDVEGGVKNIFLIHSSWAFSSFHFVILL